MLVVSGSHPFMALLINIYLMRNQFDKLLWDTCGPLMAQQCAMAHWLKIADLRHYKSLHTKNYLQVIANSHDL